MRLHTLIRTQFDSLIPKLARTNSRDTIAVTALEALTRATVTAWLSRFSTTLSMDTV